MKECRAVFFSDLHLQKLFRFWPNHLERQAKAIRKPLLYAVANGIKNVIIGGDISEDPFLSGPAMTALFRILNEFDGKLDIHIILGNHDFASTEENSLQPLIELCRNGAINGKQMRGKYKSVYVYDEPTHVRIDGVDFNMLPYPYAHKDKPHKDVSVNVAHLEWAGAMRDNGKSRIRDGYDDGRKGKDFWLIGHLHTPQYLERSRVLYCGTLYQTNFGENEDKSFCDCRFKMKNGKLLAKFVRIPANPGFTLKNMVINTQDDLAKLSKSPDMQYKLHVVEGVKVPRDLQLEYTNIRAISGIDEDAGLDTKRETAPQKLSSTHGLSTFLKEYGLNKQQRKRGKRIVQELTGAAAG